MFIGIVVLLLVLAILLIWKGSDWITDSMVPIANRFGTSYVAVTTLLVSFLLSIPEIFTAIYSYVLGYLDVGLGVVVGSVMMNIGICIGGSAVIRPLVVEKSVVLRDGIFMVMAAGIVLLFGSDLSYQRSEGFVLLLMFIPYALNVWAFEKWRPKKSQKEKVKQLERNLTLIGNFKYFNFKPSFFTFLMGAALLVGGSYLFSSSLIDISKVLPIPAILVGIIVGAIGTSIPNIAAAFQGTYKGFKDAAITETFGSNIFTLLVTLGIIVVLQPFSIAGKLFYFDLTWMIIINLLVIAFIFKGYHYKEESLTRYEGIALLLFYLAILVINMFFY